MTLYEITHETMVNLGTLINERIREDDLDGVIDVCDRIGQAAVRRRDHLRRLRAEEESE